MKPQRSGSVVKKLLRAIPASNCAHVRPSIENKGMNCPAHFRNRNHAKSTYSNDPRRLDTNDVGPEKRSWRRPEAHRCRDETAGFLMAQPLNQSQKRFGFSGPLWMFVSKFSPLTVDFSKGAES